MTWQQPQYGVKGRELNWLQSTIQSHDCFCGCNNPVKHLIEIALRSGGVFDFKAEDLKEFTQCHPTSEDHHGKDTGGKGVAITAPDDNIDLGDLERLFEEDTDFTETDSG